MEDDVAEIRPMVAADRDVVVSILVRAFRDDPGLAIVEPDATRRDTAATAFFDQFVAASLAESPVIEVFGSPALGVAIWYGPDAYGPSAEALGAAAAGSRAAPLSPEAFDRLNGLVGELEGLHARLMEDEPHHRLDFIGVDPTVQGRGIGRTLLGEGLARADAAGSPVYLETFTAANVRFYEDHGFRMLSEHTVPPSGDRVVAMLRDASPRG
jgi:ribosomal protein S18 acetylase RimI-like enzyme